ncbi:ABC transporter permease [Bradyrhizobium sp.]|uniref:ABC transporter permease n=1 Tax=Bradyrhizobium sp. TaxID=376 RepID=UPI00352EF755
MVLIVYGGQQTVAPLSELERAPVSLDPANLPLYALRTTLRMLLAMVCSTVFTFVYAAIAAKSRRAELVMIPLLDILQSVPILGFLTFTVVFFMNLFPDQVLGAELASVFAIFTSQAWNMTFSMYQSIRNVPKDLEEATQSFHLSGWQRFWHLDVPFAMPGLIWNAMMSMSGGWFFVVASEAITVGTTTVTLPGIGSYVAMAIQQQDLPAILYAMLAMLLVIIAYDQLLFRPIVAWADKFRFEQTASGEAPASWMLDLFRRTRALRALAAFPANLAFPVFVVAIVSFKLNPDIWLSPLMILGTQWYILFNVIAGASAFPTDLREAAGSFHLRGWRWWIKVILPGIFPYYVTGAITASGGSWNASIVAEVASWGDTHLKATGLGAYIASATEAGDFPRVVLGIATMCILVTLFNRLIWRPLYAFGERRLRLG